MKNQKGISMIALIITIIVIIILAAIVFIASGDTMSSAQFATFAQEFGDYQVNFQQDILADTKLKYGTEGIARSNAQLIYEAATGNEPDEGVILPAGKTYGGPALVGTGLTGSDRCWQIKDDQIEGYEEGHKFYGNNYGEETHWVTAEGVVFTLPGYPRVVEEADGEVTRMYVTPDTYYVLTNNQAYITMTSEKAEVKSSTYAGS